MSKDFKRPVGDELLTICPHCGSKNVKIVNTKDDQETTLMDEMICRDCAHAWIYRRANPNYLDALTDAERNEQINKLKNELVKDERQALIGYLKNLHKKHKDWIEAGNILKSKYPKYIINNRQLFTGFDGVETWPILEEKVNNTTQRYGYSSMLLVVRDEANKEIDDILISCVKTFIQKYNKLGTSSTPPSIHEGRGNYLWEEYKPDEKWHPDAWFLNPYDYSKFPNKHEALRNKKIKDKKISDLQKKIDNLKK